MITPILGLSILAIFAVAYLSQMLTMVELGAKSIRAVAVLKVYALALVFAAFPTGWRLFELYWLPHAP